MSKLARHRTTDIQNPAASPMAPIDVSVSLHRLFEKCWGKATSFDAANWTRGNPAFGQCAVTALVLQDLLGGQLIRAEYAYGTHYWNVLPEYGELDLTRSQFPERFAFFATEIVDREYVLSFPDTQKRYDILRRAVVKELRSQPSHCELPPSLGAQQMAAAFR